MTRTIEEIRLDVLRLAITSRPDGDALDWAAQAMLLIENGPVLEAGPEAPEPPRETVAQAIKAGREDAHVPGPAEAAPDAAGPGGPQPKIDETIARKMFDAGATFAEIGARFGVSGDGARKFAERRGWPQRRPRTPPAEAAAPHIPAGMSVADPAPITNGATRAEITARVEPAPPPAEPPHATPEPVVRQWCARWLPAQRLSDPITEAELARVDAERRRRGLTPFSRIKEIA